MKESNAFKKSIVKASYKIISLIIAFLSAAAIWYYDVSPYWAVEYKGYGTLFAIGILFCIVYWFFAKMYHALKIGLYRFTELMYFQLLAIIIADVLLMVESVIWFHGFEKFDIGTYAAGLLLQIVLLSINVFVHNRLFAWYDEPRKVMVIYGDDTYDALIRKMNAKKYRYEIIGCYSEREPLELLTDRISHAESIYLYHVDEELEKKLVHYCDGIGKNIYLTIDVDELLTMGFDVSHTFDTPFIRTKREPEKWYYRFMKRGIDIFGSILGLLILSPVLLVTAICIKVYDGGPAFYRQARLTQGHREFTIYKFRSMVADAEKNGARLASENDERVTPVGKIIRATRIDELPQLINILKGDMSIVGPRPERPEIEELYLNEIPQFGMRLKVKAGLTGYAQVFGKYNTTPEDKLKLDLLYINQRSLLLDFKIIFYTFKVILLPESTEGIEEGETTAMPASVEDDVSSNMSEYV